MASGGMLPSNDDPTKDYPGKLTSYVLITCLVAAMGGLLFCYDIGISGGVTSMPPFLEKFFPAVYRQEELDHSTNQYCKFNSLPLTMFTSSLYLAVLVASFFASEVTRRLGHKYSMLAGGVIICAGALLNAFAVHIINASIYTTWWPPSLLHSQQTPIFTSPQLPLI